MTNEINGLVEVGGGADHPKIDPSPNSRLDFAKKVSIYTVVKVSSAHASSLRNKPRKSR